MSKIFCYIDESGTLPDPHDKVVVMAAVGTDLPKLLENIHKRTRKELQRSKKKQNIHEIKFYKAGERTKQFYLKELIKEKVDIFALVVDKQDQKIPDTPENYAVLCYLLLKECLAFYKNNLSEVVFDKHFHKTSNQEEFNAILEKLLSHELIFIHVDSKQETAISAADMVAGSLLWKHSGKDSRFYELISSHVITETIVHWKEAKRKFIEQLKNPT